MVTRRELQVRLMAPPGQAGQSQTVSYQGRALTLRFGPTQPTR